ncbi:MAG: aminoacyl-tRNA hydrolase [Oligoflexia bacterium]|nr:aminoacyl-tRNA hydrolase [Oligoflexia bacterium]
MKVIVGLGNPGPKYLFTKHNLGFMVIDALAGDSPFQNKYKSLIQKKTIENETVLLVKPQTFMNLSGQAVREVTDFYKTPLENLLIIHDDKDLPFGTMKFQKSRGHGGHNGIKNIHQELQSKDYFRLKMGVTIKANPIQNTSDFVLSPFNKQEQEKLPEFLDKGVKAIECFIIKGFHQASNQFNSKTSF